MNETVDVIADVDAELSSVEVAASSRSAVSVVVETAEPSVSVSVVVTVLVTVLVTSSSSASPSEAVAITVWVVVTKGWLDGVTICCVTMTSTTVPLEVIVYVPGGIVCQSGKEASEVTSVTCDELALVVALDTQQCSQLGFVMHWKYLGLVSH